MTPQQTNASAPPSPAVATPGEARSLTEGLMQTMNALLDIVKQETELVRAGKVRDAMALETRKSEISRQYTDAVGRLARSSGYFRQSAPDLAAALQRHHEAFRATLQVNLTVLATAHAVTEGIVRGVNSELQRRSLPNGYTAAGQRAMPGPRHVTPLSVSRSL